MNTTVADNRSRSGAALWGEKYTFANTIVAYNQPDNCAVYGVITNLGYNLSSDISCQFDGPTDKQGVDPLLGELADNGGPTLTYALLPNSPAVDAGNPAAPGSGIAACVTIDQRGVDRPKDGNGDSQGVCDIGAYEASPGGLFLALTKSGTGSGVVASDPDGIDCGDNCGEVYPPGTVVTLAAAASGSSFTGWSGACIGAGVCTVTMNVARVVTATFARAAGPLIQTNGQHEVGQTIEFTATLGMSNIDACTWDFDDGTTMPCESVRTVSDANGPQSIVVHATHVYSQPGRYRVKATASNAASDVEENLLLAVQRKHS